MTKRARLADIQQRKWGKKLIEFHDIPVLLHCSRREILRWIAEKKLPVAQKTAQKDGTELWHFDPDVILSCRPLVKEWRQQSKIPLKLGNFTPNLGDSKVTNTTIARVATLDQYAAHFTTARALKRRITLITGPTNSGKSHMGLDALAESDSGYALAPLRLLAHEFQEALLRRGVKASLVTGEERINVLGSKHLAATVEMCPMNRPVDVAVIDEAQMLFDIDRGAAWTAAIMGVPARHIFLLGAPNCIHIARHIAKLCDDPIDEIVLDRKNPLRASNHPIRLGELRRGDALIAFSRREVMNFRTQLQLQGRRVAVIYGALSPEVRRAEAARFNNNEAEILVATDAIGMGLNLNIRRIIFSSLQKFDGIKLRDLSAQEIKQIGGRAGRYRKHEEGIVAVLVGGGNPNYVKSMLEAPPQHPDDLRPMVQPDTAILRAVANEIRSESLYGVLIRIQRAVLRPLDPNYKLANLDQILAIAQSLEAVPNLSLENKWIYVTCPIDERGNDIERLTQWAISHASGLPIPPVGIGHLPPPEYASRRELEQVEKRHKRLVAWQWLSQRFPHIYRDKEEAKTTQNIFNAWTEDVLRQHNIKRMNIKSL